MQLPLFGTLKYWRHFDVVTVPSPEVGISTCKCGVRGEMEMSLQTRCLSTAEAIGTNSLAVQHGLESQKWAQSFILYQTCFNSKITIFRLRNKQPPLQQAAKASWPSQQQHKTQTSSRSLPKHSPPWDEVADSSAGLVTLIEIAVEMLRPLWMQTPWYGSTRKSKQQDAGHGKAHILVGHEEPTHIYRQLLRPPGTGDRGEWVNPDDSQVEQGGGIDPHQLQTGIKRQLQSQSVVTILRRGWVVLQCLSFSLHGTMKAPGYWHHPGGVLAACGQVNESTNKWNCILVHIEITFCWHADLLWQDAMLLLAVESVQPDLLWKCLMVSLVCKWKQDWVCQLVQ